MRNRRGPSATPRYDGRRFQTIKRSALRICALRNRRGLVLKRSVTYRFILGWLGFFLLCLTVTFTDAADFRLANGNTLRGDIASANEEGLVVRLDVGGFSRREPWINFSQETLRELSQNPDVRDFVEPFVEPTPEEIEAQRKQRQITVRDVPTRMERVSGEAGLLAGFLSPIGILILIALLGANLYAAYVIARYKQQSIPLVCGVSFFLPLLGPILFLSMPARDEADASTYDVPADVDGAAARKTTAVVAEKPSSGLSLAAVGKAGPAAAVAQPQSYSRGEHTFNRRFFETKFPGFFRVVPNEAEKDLVLVMRCVKNEYVGRRVTRISSNELHLQLLNSTNEVSVPFAEITAVIVRHKDAKS
jgi:hypothetical protein